MFTIILKSYNTIGMILLYSLLMVIIEIKLNYSVNKTCHQTKVNHGTKIYHKRIILESIKTYKYKITDMYS